MSDSPTYDLVLLLDPAAEDDARAKIVTDARAAIDADGTLLGYQPWGMRALAYEIEHRTQAEYHLLQFNGPPSLIASLEHTLRITDGVVRHRVIKQPRGGLPAPAVAPPVASAPPAATAAPPAAPAPAAETAAAETAPAAVAPDAAVTPDATLAADAETTPAASAAPEPSAPAEPDPPPAEA
jgi:small subunit ribosomal protein S6